MLVCTAGEPVYARCVRRAVWGGVSLPFSAPLLCRSLVFIRYGHLHSAGEVPGQIGVLEGAGSILYCDVYRDLDVVSMVTLTPLSKFFSWLVASFKLCTKWKRAVFAAVGEREGSIQECPKMFASGIPFPRLAVPGMSFTLYLWEEPQEEVNPAITSCPLPYL